MLALKIYIHMFLCFNVYFDSCDYFVCLIPKLFCCLSISHGMKFQELLNRLFCDISENKNEITALEMIAYSNTKINTP